MSICPKCGHHTPTTNEKLRGMFAARVEKPAKVNRRNLDAAHNEMATAICAASDGDIVGTFDIAAAEQAVMRSLCVPADVLTSGTSHATATEHASRAAIDGDARAIRSVVRHAEDVIDPRSACVEPRRAVGFIEFKPGEEPERFDADWDGGVK